MNEKRKKVIVLLLALVCTLMFTASAFADTGNYGKTTLGANQPSSYKIYPTLRKKTSTTTYMTNTNTYARKTSDASAVNYYTGCWDGEATNKRASGSSTKSSGQTAKPTLYAAYRVAGVKLQLEVGNPNGVEIEVKGSWTPN